ncbi:MAG: MATE family efflux transporter [Deltaproteobacteria bacterium]|nr:MAG: MATE family efflux transporter [Deltaproteobacteria bacterium]
MQVPAHPSPAGPRGSMSPIRQEIRSLVRLAGPVMITQLGTMLLGVVDTLMLGHVGVRELAAAALGNLWIFATLLFGMGVVLGMDPIVSQAHGAGDGHRVGLTLQHGIVIALGVSLPLAVLWALTSPVLLLAGQEETLARQAQIYTWVQIPGIPFFMVYTALRQYLQGRTIVTPAMWSILIANLFNVFFNWVLIFGHLGFPALGLLGAGIATTVTRVLLLIGLVAWVRGFRLHLGAWGPWTRASFHLPSLRQVLAIGLPLGCQLFLEVWAFSISTLMAGRLGEAQLAGHSIVLNLASLSFMAPLGISIGASTRVGNLIGAGQDSAVSRACWVAFAMGAGVMTLFAAVFVLGRHWLPALYTTDPTVIEICAWILPIAALFQVFDGTQVVGGGLLRGMGRTRAAAVFNGIGYYVLALPLAWWLTFRLGTGLVGIWWGLCLGLATIATLLVLWVWRCGAALRPLER